MAVYSIPLQAVPHQQLTVQLGEQSCRIEVRQRRTGIFVDLYEQDRPIIQGVKALNLTKIVRGKYLGFDGDLFFADTQGNDPPSYTGLGTRWVLLWDTTA